ncbi:sigma-70 family RNA polymerase sigma factor [Fervidobacterium sp.]
MGTDTVRMMAESIELLTSREEVMRAFAAEDFEALGRHYYALALKEAFSRFHLLGDEALDLAQEIAGRIDRTLKAWRLGKRKIQLNSKNLTFWVWVEVQRAVREYFYRTRGVGGYTNSRLIARVKRATQELQADLGREPTPEEIAERLGVPLEVVQEALAMAEAEEILSLDDTTEEGTRFEEFVGYDPADREWEALEEAIDRYRLREKIGKVELLDRFMAGETLEEEELEELAQALKEAMTRQAATA